MGGSTSVIETDNLVKAIEELRKRLIEAEKIGLFLDGISIFVKNKKGKYEGIGNNGIEMAIGTKYYKKPKKKIVVYYHVSS